METWPYVFDTSPPPTSPSMPTTSPMWLTNQLQLAPLSAANLQVVKVLDSESRVVELADQERRFSQSRRPFFCKSFMVSIMIIMNSMDFSVNVASPDWGTLRPELGFCAPSSESSVLPFGGSFSLLGGLKVCSLLELCSLREEWWSASLLGTFGLLSASSPQPVLIVLRMT